MAHTRTWRSESKNECVQFGIASRRPSASAATRPAQGNPTVVDCGLWIADSGDTEPQEVFLVLGEQIHITIGGGEIGACPLSFPYHAT